jgi:hypothetical protein
MMEDVSKVEDPAVGARVVTLVALALGGRMVMVSLANREIRLRHPTGEDAGAVAYRLAPAEQPGRFTLRAELPERDQ